MMKCPVCGKDKAEFEMRPLVNVEELAVGDAMSDQDSKQDVGGAKLHVVCRSCWLALLEGKSKAEVMELLETICGILFEVAKERRQGAFFEPSVLIEKQFQQSGVHIQPFSSPVVRPCGVIGIGTSDGSSGAQFGGNVSVSNAPWGNRVSIPDLAARWDAIMFGEDQGTVVVNPNQ